MTPQTLIADFRKRIANIEARTVPQMNYVLMWDDGRFVGFPSDNRDPQIVGFERAAFFGDREAAKVWLRKGLTDGRNEAPKVASAFNAQQSAIAEIERVIKIVEEQVEQTQQDQD